MCRRGPPPSKLFRTNLEKMSVGYIEGLLHDQNFFAPSDKRPKIVRGMVKGKSNPSKPPLKQSFSKSKGENTMITYYTPTHDRCTHPPPAGYEPLRRSQAHRQWLSGNSGRKRCLRAAPEGVILMPDRTRPIRIANEGEDAQA